MKQKVVVKVCSMNGHKSRSKALKIVVGISGVESASLKGQEMDEIEVTGEDIDAVAIAKLLRKKIGHADLVAVAPVEEKKPEKPKDNEPVILPPWAWSSRGPPSYAVHEINDQPACCSIM